MLQIIMLSFMFVFTLSVLLLRFMFRNRLLLNKRLKEVTTSQLQTKKNEEDYLNKSFFERIIQPIVSFVALVFSRFMPSESRQKLQQTLQQAGNPGNLRPHEYQSFHLLFTIISFILVWVLTTVAKKSISEQLTLMLLVIVGAILLNKVYLNNRIRKRKTGLLKELPDAMDLLTVSVEAGLSFDAALLHVVDKSKGALAEEFRTTLKELQMGKSRREALRALGERTNVDDLLTFVGSMIQADQLGVPISRILRIQAEQVRTKRRQRVEEKAMKAPVKMLIPLVFFIFPSIFIVLLGPAAIQIYQTLLTKF
ncbi:MAG: type II secretion system protein [Firmicutes bacterium HGW-Firmicutes-12]|nr:MAG: type II secretion system protein [Firmicutes bacterium HGW-Firmicutes-12]